MKNIALRGAAVAALATASLSAQLLPIGSNIGGGDDVLIQATLPFMFPFPGGTLTDMVAISTNGWIEQDVGQTSSDLSETVADLLANAPSIRVYWDDLTSTTGAQMYLNTTIPGVAVITWMDATEFGNTGTFVVQAQLMSSGGFNLLWNSDVQMPAIDGDCLIGCGPGGGAADPGGSDLSTAVGGALVTPDDTVYELFLAGGFDMTNTQLNFVPTSPGWLVTGMTLPPPAGADPGRKACSLPVSDLTFIPTLPGYVVAASGAMDTNFASGAALTLTDDAIANNATSFMFTMPSGAVTNSIDLDSNGRLVEAGLEPSDFSPSVAEFLGDPTGIIAPFWCDFDATAGGTVYFNDDGTGSSASFTWDDVPQFGSSDGNTFQVRLFNDNSFSFHYVDLNINNDEAGTAGLASQSVVIGASAGNGVADPGESDLSSGAAVSATNVLYEFFDELLNECDLDDRLNDDLAIFATDLPAIGTNFSVDVSDADATATGVVYFFGFPTGIFVPTINLGILGVPECEVLADIVTPGALIASPSGSVGTPTVIFPIPNAPALVGVSGLVVSGLTINPGQTPLFEPTDELVITIGG